MFYITCICQDIFKGIEIRPTHLILLGLKTTHNLVSDDDKDILAVAGRGTCFGD